jgi:transposase
LDVKTIPQTVLDPAAAGHLDELRRAELDRALRYALVNMERSASGLLMRGSAAIGSRSHYAERKPAVSPPSWDSQSVPNAGPADQVGYDAGKGLRGRKRHVLVDCLGLLIAVAVTSANVSDVAGGHQLLRRAREIIIRLRPDSRRRASPRPAAQRASVASLRERLDTARSEITLLRAENAELRQQVARHFGEQRARRDHDPPERSVGDMSSTRTPRLRPASL